MDTTQKSKQTLNIKNSDDHSNNNTSSSEKQHINEKASGTLSKLVENTTLHGLNHACSSTANRIRRLLWLLLLLSMTAGYTAIAIHSFLKYYQYDTATKISHKTVTELDFPAVSICHPNLISRSLIDDDPDLRHWLLRLQRAENVASLNLTTAETEDARAVMGRYNLASTIVSNSRNMLLYCRINELLDCGHLFYDTMSEAVACLTFNGQYIVDEHGTVTTTQPGQRHGLRE